MMTNETPYCHAAGCGSTTDVRVMEIDLVDSWEASPRFTTVTIHVPFCAGCACEAERRTQAMLEARTEFYDLLHIIDAAVPYERQQREKLERAEAEVERLELEQAAARQQLRDTEAELRLARALRSLDQRRSVARPKAAMTTELHHAFGLADEEVACASDEALNMGDGVYRP